MYSKRLKRSFFIITPVIALIGAGVFAATTRRAVPIKGCTPSAYKGNYDTNERSALFEGELIPIPATVASLQANSQDLVLGVADPDERWIEVDLSEQRLRAWNGDTLILESPVSTGLPWWPTPKGEFRIWAKLRYTRMEGGEGNYYYNLPNVPFVMFFENENVPGWRGYGLHGTYWHNDFGTQRSHGCVNLPNDVAEQLYFWSTPELPEDKNSTFSSPKNEGTRIIIHD